jgi:hypothetical protein
MKLKFEIYENLYGNSNIESGAGFRKWVLGRG